MPSMRGVSSVKYTSRAAGRGGVGRGVPALGVGAADLSMSIVCITDVRVMVVDRGASTVGRYIVDVDLTSGVTLGGASKLW